MKASKQKILKLREELRERHELKNENKSLTPVGNLGIIDPDKMALLKDGFDNSRRRAEEVLSSDELNLYLKVHGQRASKLYSALSTLIYSSIGLSKAEELEQYIKRAATQVPSNLFDMDEWTNLIAVAKEVRTIDSVAARDEITLLRKNLNILHFVSEKPLKNSREELQLLKRDVAQQMQVMQQDLMKGKELILLLTSKLKDMVDKSGIEKIKEDNKELRTTYTKEFDRMQHFTDALIVKQKDDSERQRLQHREVLANMSAAHRSDIKTLKDQMKDIEDENYKKIQQLQDEVNSLKKALLSSTTANADLQAKVQSFSSSMSAALVRADIAEKSLAEMTGRFTEAVTSHAEAIKNLHTNAVADRLAESTTASVVSNMVINAHEKKIKGLEDQLKEKKSRIFSLEGESMLLYERVDQLAACEEANEKTIKELTVNMEEATTGFRRFKAASEKLEMELAGERDANNVVRETLKELKDRFESTEEELQRLKESSTSTIETLTAQLKEESRLHEEFKQLSENLKMNITKIQGQAETDAATSNEQISKLNAAMAEITAEFQASTERCDALRKDCIAKATELVALHAELAALSGKLAERSESLVAAQEEIVMLKLKIERLEVVGANQLHELTDLQQRSHNLQLDNAQLNTNIALSTEKFHHLQENFEHLSTQNEKLTKEAQDVLLDNKDLHKRLLELHFKNDLQRDRNDEVNANLEAARRRVQEVEIQALQSRSTTEVECHDLKSKLQDLTANMAEAVALNAALTQQVELLKKEVSTPETQVSFSQEEMNRYKQELAELKLANNNFLRDLDTKTSALKEKPELFMAEKLTKEVISGTISSLADFKATEMDFKVKLETARKENLMLYEKIKKLEDLLRRKDNICDDQKKMIAELQTEIGLLIRAYTSEADLVKLYSTKVAENSINTAIKKLAHRAALRLSISSHSHIGLGPPISSARSLTRISPRSTLSHQAQIIAIGSLKSEMAERSRHKNSVSSTPSQQSEIEKKFVGGLKSEDLDNQSIDTFQTNEMDVFPTSPITSKQHTYTFEFDIVPIVLIQKVARGFIARCRFSRVALEKAARDQGVLAAYKGTVQGETGWYKMNDLLFYFCFNEGEYYLLCGPLQVDAFETAKQELVEDKTVERIFGKFPLCFRLDRL
eukprot:gene24435-31820_t